jgi:hypothetical protein
VSVKSIGKDLDAKHKKAADGLDQNALSAVSKYRFSPAMYQGKPVSVQVNIEVALKIIDRLGQILPYVDPT